MPAAYNPDAPSIDQSIGPNSSHGVSGSRFNTLDSRVGIVPGATVTEALAEVKKGTFTVEDLRALAFGMGHQIVEGKETTALTAKIADLQKQNADLETRAVNAEKAFASANEELSATKGRESKPKAAKGTAS